MILDVDEFAVLTESQRKRCRDFDGNARHQKDAATHSNGEMVGLTKKRKI